WLKFWLHLKPRFFFSTPPAFETWNIFTSVILFINEHARGIPRATIHIFIAAPRRKIYFPVMQLKRDVTSGMSKIPANHSTCLFCCLCNCFYIEYLTVIIINTSDKHQGQFILV